MFTRNRGQSGFTLVELLVVVVIIVALAAIAVPIFLNQKDKADDAAIRSDIVSMSKLMANAAGAGGTIVIEDEGTKLVYLEPDGNQSTLVSARGTFTLYNSPNGVISNGSCLEIEFESTVKSYAVPNGVGDGCPQ